MRIRNLWRLAGHTVLLAILLFSWCHQQQSAYSQMVSKQIPWEPIGLSGGGGMFSPAISPADPNLIMLNCDMSAAYISEDGGRNWRMIHHAQLRSDTRCKPRFQPDNALVRGTEPKLPRRSGRFWFS